MTDAEKHAKKAERKAYKKRRREMIDKHRIHFAVYHCIYVSDIIPDIAAAVAVPDQKIAEWSETEQWETSTRFFTNQDSFSLTPVWNAAEREQLENERRSLRSAKKNWKFLIKQGQHITLDPSFNLLSEDHTPEFVWDTQSLSLLEWELPVKTKKTHWVWKKIHRAFFVLLTLPVYFSAGAGEG